MRRIVLPALIACSLLTTSCDAAKKVLSNPVVDALIKAVGPLVDLADPNLGAALDKAASVTQVLAAMQATMGTNAIGLQLPDTVQSITVQGGTFGLLSTTTYGLGSVTPASEWGEVATLINDLFSPAHASAAWYDTLPMIYDSGNQGGSTTTPTPAPTITPTAEPTTAPTTAPLGPDGLPVTVDLRQSAPSGYQLGAIRDQGQRGTCVIFSACELLDYYYPGRVHSPEFLDWLYHLDVKSKIHASSLWTDDGTYPHELVPLLTPQGNPNPDSSLPYIPAGQGVPEESVAPYEDPIPVNPPTAAPSQVAPGWLGSGLAGELTSPGGVSLGTDLLQFYLLKDDLPSLKQALSDGNPIMVAVPCYEPAWDPTVLAQNNNIIADYHGQTDQTGYHSILLVGYQVDTSQPGGGLFLIRNHWGTSWGDAGYAWLPFDTVLQYGEEPYIAKPVSGSNQTTFTASEPPAS